MTFLSQKCRLLLPFLVAPILTAFPDAVHARLSIDTSLNYSTYSAKDNQNNSLSANSLTQNYSLLYENKGILYNSRIGKYDVSLGYDWSALDTHLSSNKGSENSNIGRGHINYKGEILIDPKEVPLRFTAYSRDLTKNSLTTGNTTLLNYFFSNVNGSLLGSPTFPTDINGGLHISSGATLIAGVKNGMTNGYNEYLRHLPMIMLDYKDQIDKDLRAQTPVDTKLTRLAFVSLNKKDNWFHYRFLTYNDYINSTNNYEERQVQIGTVDQNLVRRWIDFSNWLQVSTDMQFIKRNTSSSNNYDEVDLNFFIQSRRSNWEASSFNSFNRYNDPTVGKISYRTSIPLYVSGIINKDFSWSARTSYMDSRDTTGAFVETMLAGYQIETFKNSPFNLNQAFNVETSRSEKSNLLTLAGRIEVASTPKLSKIYGFGVSYNIKNTSDYQDYTNVARETDFLEQKFALRGNYNMSNTFMLSLRQENDFTNGSFNNSVSSVRNLNTSLALPQYIAPRYGVDAANLTESYRSLTTLDANWNPVPRLNFSLSGTEDVYKTNVSDLNKISSISAAASYFNARLKFNDTLRYSEGSTVLAYGSNSSSLVNTATLDYAHSRNLNSKMSLSYNRFLDTSYSSDGFDVEQELIYSHMTSNGITRNLFDINERITYSNLPSFASNVTNGFRKTDRGTFSLGLKYYPFRQLVLSSGASFLYDTSLSNNSFVWYSSVGMNFRLLQATLDYYQGKRQLDGLVEKKFSANVKKRF